MSSYCSLIMFNKFRSVFHSSNEMMDSNLHGCSSKEEESLDGEFIFIKKLSDNGKFAYGGLCSVALHHLFCTQDKEFEKHALNIITNNLALDEQKSSIFERILICKSVTPIQDRLLCFKNILYGERILNSNRKLIIHDLLSLALLQGHYDARWRALINYIASELDVRDEVEKHEIALAEFLLKGSKSYTQEELAVMKKNKKIEQIKRYSIITAVVVGSGALIGLSGGLAAPIIVETVIPLLGASSAAVALTSLSAVATNTIIGGIFGTAGASLVGYKMQKRIGNIKEFKFGQLFENGAIKRDDILQPDRPQLSVTIAISGWISDLNENNFALPWRRMNMSREQYYLHYESQHLLEVGKILKASTFSGVSTFVKDLSKYDLLPFLTKTAVRSSAPGLLLGLTSAIDFPWSVCCSRAVLVGKQLAEVLLAQEHGHRPVTLIGYSFGARVIFYCLLEMLERDGRGIIEDVYLIGAPCPADSSTWSCISNIVAGQITNAYSCNDKALKYLYSLLSLPSGGPAGTKAITVSDKRIINKDISSIIKGHREYPDKLDLVLKELGIKLHEELPRLTSLLQPGPSK